MKSLKFAMGLALIAAGVSVSAEAMASDATRCSGKGCLDVPMSQPLMHSEAVVFDENGNQLVYSEGDVQVMIDENGYPVLQAPEQSFNSIQ